MRTFSPAPTRDHDGCMISANLGLRVTAIRQLHVRTVISSTDILQAVFAQTLVTPVTAIELVRCLILLVGAQPEYFFPLALRPPRSER